MDKLPMFESMVSDGIAYTREQFHFFLKAKGKPHAMDDSIIDRGIRVFQDQLEEADCHDRQISRWRSQEITESQRARVAQFEASANQYRDITKQVLDLLEELRAAGAQDWMARPETNRDRLFKSI